MSQFNEGKSGVGKCPICDKPVVKRTTRGKEAYCSRVCASQERYTKRYRGTMSGPRDKPTKISKITLP